MIYYVLPYILAIDLAVPHQRLDQQPVFHFNVDVNSTVQTDDSEGTSYMYGLTTVLSCKPYQVDRLRCYAEDTNATYGQQLKGVVDLDDPIDLSMTEDLLFLKFDENEVKVSTLSNVTSERSLRMLRKIVDLLRVDVDFDGERRGHSRLETIIVVDDCPITTKANFQPIRMGTRKTSDEWSFSLVSHPDEFDANSAWILDVNRTMDITKCRNSTGFLFGSRGENDVHNGGNLYSNVTSTINRIKITNDKFVSSSHIEGTVTSGAIKFFVQETISVTITTNDIYVPVWPGSYK